MQVNDALGDAVGLILITASAQPTLERQHRDPVMSAFQKGRCWRAEMPESVAAGTFRQGSYAA